MIGRQEVAEPREIGVPLAEDLVGEAAAADLVLDLAVFVRPVGLHETNPAARPALRPCVERLEDRAVRKVELLRVVVAR